MNNPQPGKMSGFVFRFKDRHIRVFSNGIERGNRMGGRVHFFPWAFGKYKDGFCHGWFVGIWIFYFLDRYVF